MRLLSLLIAGTLCCVATGAAAQDTAATQVLRRVCLPFVEGTGDDDFAAADAAARAMGLTVTEQRADEALRFRTKTYTLQQSGGTYRVTITTQSAGESCTLVAPDRVSIPQLEQAVANAVGGEWEVELGQSTTWTKPLDWGWVAIISVDRTGSGAPGVFVRTDGSNADDDY